MRDVDEMIERLLDMDIVKADNTVAFSNEARQLIHEIAEKCSTIPIVDETREQAEEYARGLSADTFGAVKKESAFATLQQTVRL